MINDLGDEACVRFAAADKDLDQLGDADVVFLSTEVHQLPALAKSLARRFVTASISLCFISAVLVPAGA